VENVTYARCANFKVNIHCLKEIKQCTFWNNDMYNLARRHYHFCYSILVPHLQTVYNDIDNDDE